MTLYFERDFLNDDMRGGSAHFIIEVHGPWKDVAREKGISMETPFSGSITVADCTTQANLSLSFENKDRFLNSKHKAIKLRDALSRLIEYMETAEPFIPEKQPDEHDD